MSNPKPRQKPDAEGRLPPVTARGPKPGSRTKSFPRWLRAKTPAALVVETTSGETKQLRVTSGKAGNAHGKAVNWKQLVEDVESLDPVKVEALDEQGDTLGCWTFDDATASALLPASLSGVFAPAEGDTADVTVLKTFGALLADAHNKAADRLCSVVDIQARNFSEERRHMAASLMNMDRIVQRATRGNNPRLRVAAGGEEEEVEVEETDTNSEFIMTMVKAAMAKNAAAENVSNGAASAPPKGATS